MVVYQCIVIGCGGGVGDVAVATGQANVTLAVVLLLNCCGGLVRYRTPYAAAVAVVTAAAYIIANGTCNNTDSLTLRVYVLVCGLAVSVFSVRQVR